MQENLVIIIKKEADLEGYFKNNYLQISLVKEMDNALYVEVMTIGLGIVLMEIKEVCF